jgi:hypothetical protein
MTTMSTPETLNDSLDGRVQSLIRRAADVGVPMRHLGVGPLIPNMGLCTGPCATWLLVPVAAFSRIGRREIPLRRLQLRALGHLRDAGLDFPAVYLAYQIGPDRSQPADCTAEAEPHTSNGTCGSVADADLLESITVTQPPARTVALATCLGRLAGALLRLQSREVEAARHVPQPYALPSNPPATCPPASVVIVAWTGHEPAAFDAPAAWLQLAVPC